jgi:hypothetical protein
MAEWIKTAILIVTLALAVLVGSFGAQWLGSTRGDFGPTILQTVSPLSATISILMVITVATLLGIPLAKVSSAASGMFVVGFALFGLSMRTQGVTDFIFSEGSSTTLMIEALVLSLILLLSSVVMFKFGGPLKDVPRNQNKSWDASFSPRSIAMTLLVSLAMLPMIWLVAVSPSKGQVIGAAVVGGIVVACLARKFMPHLQPIMLFSTPTAIAAIGYFVANSMGISDIAFTQNTISPLIFPMPLEYAGGSLMGIAIGLSWGTSLAEKVGPETWISMPKI